MAEEKNPDLVEARRRLVEEGFIDPTTEKPVHPEGRPARKPDDRTTTPDAPSRETLPTRRRQPSAIESEAEILRRIERSVRSTEDAVSTIKSILVFFTALWALGVGLWVIAILFVSGDGR